MDPRALHQADVCVHCGLCLPACPTYLETGDENDSPRGRILLMKSVASGRLPATPAVLTHLDRCLDCRGCETACPSGVIYHELIEDARASITPEKPRKKSLDQRLVDFVCHRVMTHPTRLKLALLPARLLQRVGLWGVMSKLAGKIAGPRLAKMQQMLPPQGAIWPRRLSEQHAARGEAKMTVGLLAGCIGSVLFDPVNRRTIELLTHLGCEVRVPRAQRCCGAIDHHAGDRTTAAAMARRNIEAFAECDRIVANIAGCGAMLREYDDLLRDDPAWVDRAREFAARVRDVSELIAELDPPPPPHRVELTATYHDACHLAHAQKVTQQPRDLLAKVQGLTLIPLPESDVCCGAAGTYNLQQPAMSSALAARKLDNIRSTGATTCITGNVGCAMQIKSQAAAMGMSLDVLHPVEVLHRAYLQPTPTTPTQRAD